MKSMRNIFKKAIGVMGVVLSVTALGSVSNATSPYKTYTLDGYGKVSETQSAYLAYETISQFDTQFMSNPSDIFVTDDGYIYVADTGNSRILVGNIDGELIRIIGEGTLVTPKGVCVTDDGNVFVADRDAGAVFEFSNDGELINTYTRPDSPLYGSTQQFLPIKVKVNNTSGTIYVICESNTNGIVELQPKNDGTATFLGYFGTNYASADLKTIIYRAILTDEQQAKMVANIPATPDNMDLDEKGLVYTVTRGDEYTTLKRLNIAGTNLISENDAYSEIPAAVAAGNHDNVYVADQQGYIFEYNSEGEMLFVFGGLDDGTQRVGLSTLVSGIDVDTEDRIYLLDSDKSQIQVYEPTEFTNLLHEALALYAKGRYTESKEPLQKVLDMNSMFDYANKAMGRAYFQEEDYENALYYARLAKDYDGYSDSYWEVRNLWLKKNLVTLVIVLVLIYATVKILKMLDKKKGIFNKVRDFNKKAMEKKVIDRLSYGKYYMFHPFDASYGIARQGKASIIAPTIILIIFTIFFVVDKYLCGFLWKTIRDGRYEILSDVGTIFIAIIAITACNYLVCTINDGEGTPKKIYTYFCYSLLPYVYITPIIFIFTHILTNNEQFLITLARIVMFTWIIVLGVIGIKEVNNYNVKETVKVILLTIFTILIMALLIFIIYVLWAQVFQFISAIFGEVVYRLGY